MKYKYSLPLTEQEIIARYRAGDSARLLARLCGVGIGTIHNRLREYGANEPNRRRDQSGSNNAMYKNGLSRATISRTTRVILREARINQQLCMRCGAQKPRHEGRHNVHHKDRNRANNTLENLEVLCVSCHAIEHNNPRNNETGQWQRQNT